MIKLAFHKNGRMASSISNQIRNGKGTFVVTGSVGTGKTSMGATCILDGERALGLMPNFASFDEMQQKVDLQSGIGDLEAKQSTLISMPAFCQNIVMDVGIYERVLSPMMFKAFLAEHVHALPLGKFSNVNSIDKLLSDALYFFSMLAKEGIDETRYQTYANNMTNAKWTNDEFLDFQRGQLDLSKAYSAFRLLLKEHKVVDSNNVVLDAMLYLEREPFALKQLLDDYDKMIVDDAHTLTPAAARIIKAIIKSSSVPSTVLFQNLNCAPPIPDSVQFTTIQAKENFRNSQIVQMTSKKIAQDTFKDAPSEMVKILPTWEDEIEYITSKVEHFYNSAKDKTIAVVCMNDTDMQRIANTLNLKKVKFNSVQKYPLLQEPLTKSIVNFLSFLVNQKNSILAYQVLTCPEFQFSPNEFANIVQSLPTKRNLDVVLQLTKYVQENAGPQASVEIASKFLNSIGKFSALLESAATPKLVQEYLEHFRSMKSLTEPTTISDEHDSVCAAQLLNLVQEIERSFPNYSTSQVIQVLASQHWHSLKTDSISDARVDILKYRSDFHGNVYDHLLIMNMRDTAIPGRFVRPAFPLPLNITTSKIAHNRAEHIEHSRLVLSERICNAKDSVVFTCAEKQLGLKKDAKLCPFLPKSPPIVSSPPPLGNKQPQETNELERVFQQSPDPTIASPWLSFSQIYEYNTCPYRYYLSRVLKLSAAPKPFLVYGSAMHEAVDAFNNYKPANAAPNITEHCVSVFRTAFSSSNCKFLSIEQEENLLAAGTEGIQHYCARHTNAPAANIQSEVSFQVSIPNTPIQLRGIFDQLHISENGNSIVEYKSNPSARARDVEHMAASSLQLKLYMLAHSELYSTPLRSARLEMIETGFSAQVEPTNSSHEEARDSISSTLRGIQAKDYHPEPSYMACTYCSFSDICNFRSKIMQKL